MALNTAIRGLQIRDGFFGDGIKRNDSDGDIAELALKSSGGLKIDTAELAIEPDDFAGNGLADDGSDNLKLDINGLSDTGIDVANDFLAFDDATDSEAKKESIVDFVSAIAGDGLTEDSDGVLDVEVDDSTIEIDTDTLRVKDGGITEPKLDIVNSTVDGYVLSWSDGDGQMKWIDIDANAVQNADIIKEDLTSDIDASGYAGEHTLSNTPVANSLQLFLNGILQQEGSGNDYELSGTTITFSTAPESGDIVIAHYVISD